MPDNSPLLVIRLTPPGRGAVASLRIDGPGAVEVVARNFAAHSGKPLRDFPPGRIAVGQFGAGGEEVVIQRQSDSAVELHCHGGLAAVSRIEEILVGSGCRQMSWQAWTASQEADPFSAAARLALAETRTTRTAAIVLDQYRGALRRAVEEIEASIQAGSRDLARKLVETLLGRANTGLHLVRPWQIVVAGQPNVGKSSLVNAMAGFPRAIVHSMPGTTRDIVGVQTAMDGWPVEVFDTAGLRESTEKIEQVGMGLAREKLQTADLIVLVFDNSLPWSERDQALVDAYPTALVVHNKSDLGRASGNRPSGLELSAIQPVGIDGLCHEIAGRLVPRPPPPGAGVPFEQEQVGQIRRFLERI
jgi:tRNA modification GTPase